VILLRQVFARSLSKRFADPPDYNEDCFLVSPSGQSAALSDGAGDSYDSRTLARLVCEDWLSQERPRLRLGKLCDRYLQHFARKVMSWSDQEFERSFATLLGVHVKEDFVHVFAVGDSIAVVHSGAGFTSFPMCSAEDFRARPTLISSKREFNKAIKREHVRRVSWKIRPGDRLLLLTDALGAWLLAQDDRLRALSQLENLDDDEQFTRFVEGERDKRLLKNDDTTLVHLEAGDGA